jgi:hypothetical protein
MRAFLGELPLSATGLTTRVWWQSGNTLRIDLFLAPTCVRGWVYVFRKIAARTSPLFYDRRLFFTLAVGPLHGRAFILGPFLYAANVKDCPACPT